MRSACLGPVWGRHALAYVLNNWRKHREDREAFARGWKVDPYSTGALFSGWKERGDDPLLWKLPETYEPLFVWFPKTWLLNEGWRRYGLIRMDEVPSAPACCKPIPVSGVTHFTETVAALRAMLSGG